MESGSTRSPSPSRTSKRSVTARKVVQKKMFPGYLLIRCELDDDSWYVIRNTPGVTGFVGAGNKPSPLPRVRSKRSSPSRKRTPRHRPAAVSRAQVRASRVRSRQGRPIRRLQRRDRRNQYRPTQGQSACQHLRSRDSGGARVEPGCQAVAVVPLPATAGFGHNFVSRASSLSARPPRRPPATPIVFRKSLIHGQEEGRNSRKDPDSSGRRYSGTAGRYRAWPARRRDHGFRRSTTRLEPKRCAAPSFPARSPSTRTARSHSSPRPRRRRSSFSRPPAWRRDQRHQAVALSVRSTTSRLPRSLRRSCLT